MAGKSVITGMHGRLRALMAAVLVVVAGATWQAPAAADGGYAQGEWIQARTEQGCLIFIDRYFSDFETPESFWSKNTFDYVGSGCEPGELLNGTGTLRLRSTDGAAADYQGRFVNGVAQGQMKVTYPDFPPDFWRDEEYRDGCPAADIYEYGCQPFTGNAVALVPSVPSDNRPQFADRASGSGTGSAPAPFAPAAATANGNVWGTCVATVHPYRSGIQMIYALRNRCDKAITVSFCMRATYEAAGDWNLCSQREYKTYDIRAGDKFEFPFTPVTPGSAMSDGRVVDYNEVSARGAACIGSSPSVYIENKDLIFQHC